MRHAYTFTPLWILSIQRSRVSRHGYGQQAGVGLAAIRTASGDEARPPGNPFSQTMKGIPL